MSTLAPPSPSLLTPNGSALRPGALRGESFASARSYFSAESGSFVTAASSPGGLVSQPMSRTPSFTAPPSRPSSLGTSRATSYSMGSTASRGHSASYFPPASRASSRLTLPPSRASSSLFDSRAGAATTVTASAPTSPTSSSPTYSPLPHISVSAAPPAPLATRPSVSTRPSFSRSVNAGPDVVAGSTPAQPTAPGRPRFLDLPSRTHSAAAVSPSVAAADTPVFGVAAYPVTAATAAAMEAPSAVASPAPAEKPRVPPAPSPHLMLGTATAATPWSAPPTAPDTNGVPSPASGPHSEPLVPATPILSRPKHSPHRRDALRTLATPDIPSAAPSPGIPAVPPSTAATLNPHSEPPEFIPRSAPAASAPAAPAPKRRAPQPAELCARLERTLESSFGRIVDNACHVNSEYTEDAAGSHSGGRSGAVGYPARPGENQPSRLRQGRLA